MQLKNVKVEDTKRKPLYYYFLLAIPYILYFALFLAIDIQFVEGKIIDSDLNLYISSLDNPETNEYFFRFQLLPIPLIPIFQYLSLSFYTLTSSVLTTLFLVRVLTILPQILVTDYFVSKYLSKHIVYRSIITFTFLASPIIFVMNFHLLRQAFGVSLFLLGIYARESNKAAISVSLVIISTLVHETMFPILIVLFVSTFLFHPLLSRRNGNSIISTINTLLRSNFLFIALIVLLVIWVAYIPNLLSTSGLPYPAYFGRNIENEGLWFLSSLLMTIFLVTLIVVMISFYYVPNEWQKNVQTRILVLSSPLILVLFGWVRTLLFTNPIMLFTLSKLLISKNNNYASTSYSVKYHFEMFCFVLIGLVIFPFVYPIYRFLPIFSYLTILYIFSLFAHYNQHDVFSKTKLMGIIILPVSINLLDLILRVISLIIL